MLACNIWIIVLLLIKYHNLAHVATKLRMVHYYQVLSCCQWPSRIQCAHYYPGDSNGNMTLFRYTLWTPMHIRRITMFMMIIASRWFHTTSITRYASDKDQNQNQGHAMLLLWLWYVYGIAMVWLWYDYGYIMIMSWLCDGYNCGGTNNNGWKFFDY